MPVVITVSGGVVMKKALLAVVALALVGFTGSAWSGEEKPLAFCQAPNSSRVPFMPGEPIAVPADDLAKLLAVIGDPQVADHPCLDCLGCCANWCNPRGGVSPWYCWTCC